MGFYEEGDSFFGGAEPEHCEDFFTEEYQKRLLKYEMDSFITEKMVRYYIFCKDVPGRIIGTVSLQNIVRGCFCHATIGYKMLEAFTGMGYCTEAVLRITQAAFEDGDIHRISAYVQPENAASIRVLDRCGYEREGLIRDYVCLRGVWQDHLVYGAVRQQKTPGGVYLSGGRNMEKIKRGSHDR